MFTRENLITVLKALETRFGKDLRIFFSEAHFQLLFAMEVLKLNDSDKFKFSCEPEFPINHKDKKYEIDLLIEDRKDKTNTIIEFKYKTLNSKSENKMINIPTALSQVFIPTSHMARDLGRFDVFSDLERTKSLVDDNEINVTNGFIVFLTNDHNYWETANQKNKYGNDFSLENDRKVKAGELRWRPKKGVKLNLQSIGKDRKRPIEIKNDFTILWNDYYSLLHSEAEINKKFKLLAIEVNKDNYECIQLNTESE